ncbi:LysR substrate binding domain protein [Acetobacteraceae bacterium AT-5844]|nr:LysR substrate binding domain protein [Acetobacteraceae bacterium AT-5844]
MDLTQIRTLIQVAELGSLSKAAARLHIAQSALSRQMRLLEQELGIPLFTRHGRGMVITDAGREVLRSARLVMTGLEGIRAAASSAGATLAGQVAIGIPPAVAHVVARPLMAAFRRQHPKVMVRLVTAFTGDLLDLLQRGEVDLAVLSDPRATRLLRSEWLMQERLFLIGPPGSGLTMAQPVGLRDAAQRDLLLPSRRQGLRVILEGFVHGIGASLNVVGEVDSYAVLQDLVRHGHGHTILSLAALHDEVVAGRLTAAPIVGPEISRRLALSYPSDRPVARAAQFAGETLKDIVIERVGQGEWPGEMLLADVDGHAETGVPHSRSTEVSSGGSAPVSDMWVSQPPPPKRT